MPLEIFPNELDRIEFRGVRRKEFDMKSRKTCEYISNIRPLVDGPLVQECNDFAGEMPQQHPEESRDVLCVEVSLLEASIQAHVTDLGGYGETGDGGDAIPLKVDAYVGRLAFRSPGSAARGNEQKPAFVDENEVGAQFAYFFL